MPPTPVPTPAPTPVPPPGTLGQLQDAARDAVFAEAARVATLLLARYGGSTEVDGAKLASLFRRSFSFNAQYTWQVFEDGATTFVTTGDIGQMWLRDSAVQHFAYLPLARRGGAASPLRRVLESVMARQRSFILDDPYGSAFFPSQGPGRDAGPNKDECGRAPNCADCNCTLCTPQCGNYTYQHDYELDSLLFPLLLHHRYWKETGETRHLTADLAQVLRAVLKVLRTEQNHFADSPYYYKPLPGGFADGTGLVWSFARPSDDQTQLGYNIPQNMMVVVVLRHAAEMAAGPLSDPALAAELAALSDEVDAAVLRHGIVAGPRGPVYAFEVDGWGNATAPGTDDAGMPNLLWIPHLGYPDYPQLYEATRALVLSPADPDFFNGTFPGLGSQHESHGLRGHHPGRQCYGNCTWHLGLVMQGWTARDAAERTARMREVLATDAAQGLLHEGFDPNDPTVYNRDWFGWVDALFCEWVIRDWL